MAEMVPLEFLVDKSIADNIYEKGWAEVVSRRADAKFKSMVKCRLLDESGIENEITQKVISSSMSMSFSSSYSMESVRSNMNSFEHNIGNNLSTLTDTTKNMASHVDSIYQLTKSLQTISFVNTGISLANLAVDVIGFVVINKKLNTLNNEVQNIEKFVVKIYKNEVNKKITTCQEIIGEYISLYDRIQDSKVVSIEEIDSLLNRMRPFISDIGRNITDDVLDLDFGLNMINTLLPAYTLLLNEYIKRKYYEKQEKPLKYVFYVSLYDELDNEKMRQKLQDYFFIEQKKYVDEVFELLDAHSLIVLNGRVQIEDQLSILEKYKTKELVDTFDLELDNSIKYWVRKKNEKIAEKNGISNKKCKQILRENGLI